MIWWKPNGLPASEVKEMGKRKTFGGSDHHFYFLYHIKDQRLGKNAVVTGAGGSGCVSSETGHSGSGKHVIVGTNAKPDFWNSVDARVRISTEGDRYVWELTSENGKLSTLVGGRAATIEDLKGQANCQGSVSTDFTAFELPSKLSPNKVIDKPYCLKWHAIITLGPIGQLVPWPFFCLVTIQSMHMAAEPP